MVFRFDLICLLVTVATSVMTILSKDSGKSNTDLAFTLQIIVDVVNFFSTSLRMFAEVDNNMTSA